MASQQIDLTTDRLKQVLHYDPTTGTFTWRSSRGRIKFGAVAGSDTGEGYLQIKIDGRVHKAHRLAWLYMTGRWPEDQIDHRNRAKADNRWDNLREASGSQNSMNRPLTLRNKSGHRGVRFLPDRRKWAVEIGHGRKKRYLGAFATLADAVETYRRAATELHGDFASIDRRINL